MYCEKEFLELLETVCKIPAPSGDEDKRVKFCLDWLGSNGIEAYADSAKNVIVPMGDVEKGNITVFLAHTDLVFPDTDELPFEIRDGKAFSPGVGDNTVHLVQLLLTAKYMKENGIIPNHGILLVFNSCEEGLGNLKGIKQIMSDFEGKIREVISFDGGYKALVTKCVGSERYRVVVKTEGGHSFGAFGNRNAIEKLADLICDLYKIEVPHKGNSKTTYNVGCISGGTSVNTIAQSAEMLYEYRSDENECVEEMRKLFFAEIEKRREAGLDIEVEILGVRPCGKGVDEKALSALAERCATICKEASGIEVAYRSGSTDSNIPMSMGIPSVTVGGYLGGGAHTREEWAEVSSFSVGYEIVKNTVISFAKE